MELDLAYVAIACAGVVGVATGWFARSVSEMPEFRSLKRNARTEIQDARSEAERLRRMAPFSD